jgi:hypothetical protein
MASNQAKHAPASPDGAEGVAVGDALGTRSQAAGAARGAWAVLLVQAQPRRSVGAKDGTR